MSERIAGIPEIKICGLTRVDEAVASAKAGADAIGLVFFERSPRNVTVEQAGEISRALPGHTASVGVFVNASLEFIKERVESCGLDFVQLHGKESPGFVTDLNKMGLSVIKGLYLENSPYISEADQYPAAAFLVECAKGVLPGGNALSWNFKRAGTFGETHPLIIAGGLSPENVGKAVRDAFPDAVDVSSGVESTPGRKDISRVIRFIEGVKTAFSDNSIPIPEGDPSERRTPRRIFKPQPQD